MFYLRCKIYNRIGSRFTYQLQYYMWFHLYNFVLFCCLFIFLKIYFETFLVINLSFHVIKKKLYTLEY